MNVIIDPKKNIIAIYPIFLFYLFIDWFLIFIWWPIKYKNSNRHINSFSPRLLRLVMSSRWKGNRRSLSRLCSFSRSSLIFTNFHIRLSGGLILFWSRVVILWGSIVSDLGGRGSLCWSRRGLSSMHLCKGNSTTIRQKELTFLWYWGQSNSYIQLFLYFFNSCVVFIRAKGRNSEGNG